MGLDALSEGSTGVLHGHVNGVANACNRSGTARAVMAGSSFEYKYYKTGTDGKTVIFEGGDNRTYTVPEGCVRNVVQVDTWRE